MLAKTSVAALAILGFAGATRAPPDGSPRGSY
jgi:hypothetical protein